MEKKKGGGILLLFLLCDLLPPCTPFARLVFQNPPVEKLSFFTCSIWSFCCFFRSTQECPHQVPAAQGCSLRVRPALGKLQLCFWSYLPLYFSKSPALNILVQDENTRTEAEPCYQTGVCSSTQRYVQLKKNL